MLSIDDTGTIEWYEDWPGGWQVCGVSVAFGPVYPLMRPHNVRDMPVDKGQILAYRVMEEVTYCMNGDVGGPVQLMTAVGVTEGGRSSTLITSLKEPQLKALHSDVERWRRREGALFTRLPVR